MLRPARLIPSGVQAGSPHPSRPSHPSHWSRLLSIEQYWWHHGSQKVTWAVFPCLSGHVLLKKGHVKSARLFFLVWNDGPKWLRLCWHLRVLYCRWAWRSSSQLSKNQKAIFIVGGVLKWGYLKWMVYREHPIKMILKNDLGYPYFRKPPVQHHKVSSFKMDWFTCLSTVTKNENACDGWNNEPDNWFSCTYKIL